MKPLDFPPEGEVWVRVRGFKAAGLKAAGVKAADNRGDKEGIVEWEVEFPYGYHDVFEVRMGEVSRKDWTRLRKVEMEARFGEGGLEWEFCVDGLGVEVFGEGEGGEGKEVFGEGLEGEGTMQRILTGRDDG